MHGVCTGQAYLRPQQPRRCRACATARAGLQSHEEFKTSYENASERVQQLSDAELKAQLEYMLAPEPSATEQYDGPPIDELKEKYNQSLFVEVVEGPSGFPIIVLRHHNGCQALVHAHGGVVSSWVDKFDNELLATQALENYDPGETIGGGARLEFPIVGAGLPTMDTSSAMPEGGFFALGHMAILATHANPDGRDVAPGVTFFSESCAATRDIFPHEWEMSYMVSLTDDTSRKKRVPQAVFSPAALDAAAADDSSEEEDIEWLNSDNPVALMDRAKYFREESDAVDWNGNPVHDDDDATEYSVEAWEAKADAKAKAEQDDVTYQRGPRAKKRTKRGLVGEAGYSRRLSRLEFGAIETPLSKVRWPRRALPAPRPGWEAGENNALVETTRESRADPDPADAAAGGRAEGSDEPSGDDEDASDSEARSAALARAQGLRPEPGDFSNQVIVEAESAAPATEEAAAPDAPVTTESVEEPPAAASASDEEEASDADEDASSEDEEAVAAEAGAAAEDVEADARFRELWNRKLPIQEEQLDLSRGADVFDPDSPFARELEDSELPGKWLAEQAPAQLQICVAICNTGDDTFEFQAAAVADLATKDLRVEANAEQVRLMGLVGRAAIDGSDASRLRPVYNDEFFTTPTPAPGKRVDLVFPKVEQSDVYFCPGTRTHFQLVMRQGFSDAIVRHPGLKEDTAKFVTVGAARAAAPVSLEPGHTWLAEFSFRRFYEYWPENEHQTDAGPLPEAEDVVLHASRQGATDDFDSSDDDDASALPPFTGKA